MDYIQLHTSLAQQLADEARVLIERAGRYRDEGKPDYAVGCLRKADKKLARAVEMVRTGSVLGLQ